MHHYTCYHTAHYNTIDESSFEWPRWVIAVVSRQFQPPSAVSYSKDQATPCSAQLFSLMAAVSLLSSFSVAAVSLLSSSSLVVAVSLRSSSSLVAAVSLRSSSFPVAAVSPRSASFPVAAVSLLSSSSVTAFSPL